MNYYAIANALVAGIFGARPYVLVLDQPYCYVYAMIVKPVTILSIV